MLECVLLALKIQCSKENNA